MFVLIEGTKEKSKREREPMEMEQTRKLLVGTHVNG